MGFDLDAIREEGRYIALDAADTLSKFMVDNWPDEARFNDVVGGVVARARRHGATDLVSAFGEMVALLCDDGNPAGAIRLEQLWNRLAETHRFALFCAYPLELFRSKVNADALLQICHEHSLVIPAENPR